jgi:hypothetical protein
MIDNEYVFELDVIFDTKQLISIINNLKVSGLRHHQQNAVDYEYTNYLFQKHKKILGSVWNFYFLKPQTGFPTHIDAKRTATLNIPLLGHQGSITTFYEMPTDELVYSDKLIGYEFESTVNKTFEFTLTKPSFVRVDAPHSVMAGKQHRLIISWGLAVSFNEAKEYFNEYGLD